MNQIWSRTVVPVQKKLFAYINAKKKTQPLACLKVNNKIINNDSGIAEALREYFHSTFITPTNIPNISQSCSVDNFVPFFTKFDILNLLSELDENCSPGPDGIHPTLLKKLSFCLERC